jgi:hypothetical protein
MTDKYQFILETKQEVSEQKAKTIFDYLRIIADQIGLKLLRKEPTCQERNSASQTQPEQSKD